MDQAMIAAAQRHWLYRLEGAEQQHLAQVWSDEEQRAQAEAEAEAKEWAELEAYDAAGKKKSGSDSGAPRSRTVRRRVMRRFKSEVWQLN